MEALPRCTCVLFLFVCVHASQACWYLRCVLLLAYGSRCCFLFQILQRWSQRYENSSRAAVSPARPRELVCVCGAMFVCVSLDCLYLSPCPDPPSQGKHMIYIDLSNATGRHWHTNTPHSTWLVSVRNLASPIVFPHRRNGGLALSLKWKRCLTSEGELNQS